MQSNKGNRQFISEVLRSLRPQIMASYGTVLHEIKDNLTPVTEIDKEVEKVLKRLLLNQYPDIGFLGEEGGRSGNADRYWLVDPIDGTENYIRGLPGVTSIIGLVENERIVESYIFDPVENVLYHAQKGKGAFADGVPISVVERPLNRSFISFSSGFDNGSPLPDALLKEGAYYLSKFLGAGIKAVYLASGKIDGIIIKSKRPGGEWDYAPTRFLAQEAGAVFTPFDGDRLDSKMYALLTPSVHKAIIATVKETIHV